MTKTRKSAKSTKRKITIKARPRPKGAAKAASRASRAKPTRARAPARATAKLRSKAATSRPVRATPKLAARVFARTASRAAKKSLQAPAVRAAPKIAPAPALVPRAKSRRGQPAHPSRPATVARNLNRHVVRMARVPQFTYMKAPGPDSGFNVGDSVEVFCDHERESERVRGWVKGVVVQVDNKLVAVQFRSNVFLTDGWMVPDRILWYSLTSDQIRNIILGRKASRKVIPDY
jgi:hypothetical protein